MLISMNGETHQLAIGMYMVVLKARNTRFSFYFPPKEKYQGRFFQYITPFPDSETLSQGATGEENKNRILHQQRSIFYRNQWRGRIDFAKPGFSSDPSIGAYRANAASAQFSRVIAAQIYQGNTVLMAMRLVAAAVLIGPLAVWKIRKKHGMV